MTPRLADPHSSGGFLQQKYNPSRELNSSLDKPILASMGMAHSLRHDEWTGVDETCSHDFHKQDEKGHESSHVTHRFELRSKACNGLTATLSSLLTESNLEPDCRIAL